MEYSSNLNPRLKSIDDEKLDDEIKNADVADDQEKSDESGEQAENKRESPSEDLNVSEAIDHVSEPVDKPASVRTSIVSSTGSKIIPVDKASLKKEPPLREESTKRSIEAPKDEAKIDEGQKVKEEKSVEIKAPSLAKLSSTQPKADASKDNKLISESSKVFFEFH